MSPLKFLAIIAATAAIGLFARALHGPLSIGSIHINSPLALESTFAVAILSLILLRGSKAESIAPPISSPPKIPLIFALVVVAVAFSANLSDPFLSDDYILVSRASLDLSRFLTSLHTPGGDGSFRPIGYLYFDLVSTWAKTDPSKWHACGLSLHLVNCALLYLIVWNLWPQTLLAAASALLFGLHGTRPEVVTWTAGGFDLLACMFTLAALFCIFRKSNVKSYGAVSISLLLLVLAVLSKESAYAAVVVLLGLSIAAGRVKDWPVRTFLWTGLVTSAILFAYRWTLFGGPGGYVDPATKRSQILSLHALTALKALLVRIWAILLFPVNWEAGHSLWLALALVGACGTLLFVCLHGAPLSLRITATLLLMTAGSVIPAIHLALIGDSALGSRVLYLPSIGFCILCAHLLASLPPRRRTVVIVVAFACTGAVLAHNLQAWHRVALAAARVCSTEALHGSSPPGTRQGVFFFANGFPECVSMAARHE